MKFDQFGNHSRQIMADPFLGGHVQLATQLSQGVSVSHSFSYGNGPHDQQTATTYESSINISGKKTAFGMRVFPPSHFLARVTRSLGKFFTVNGTLQNAMPDAAPVNIGVDSTFKHSSFSLQLASDMSTAMSMSIHPSPSLAVGASLLQSQGQRAGSLAVESSFGSLPSLEKDTADVMPRVTTTSILTSTRHFVSSTSVNLSDSFTVCTELSTSLAEKQKPSVSLGYRYRGQASGIEVRGKVAHNTVMSSIEGCVLPGVVIGGGIAVSLRERSSRTGISLTVG
ncbi:hypothetical protein GEMRC1_005706 [Eukaryota sp. GEM-RC1]